MDFDEALQYLLSLGHETLSIKLGLRNTKLLLNSLSNPEKAFPAVQIAGTNGKGSTSSFLDSICRCAGIKTGLYTSPHLESITERIKLDGMNISREDFARHTTTVRNAAEFLLNEGAISALPTFFEQITAIALVAFRDARVKLAILETGLGGRLDSTTAVGAEVCGITRIGFDHQEYLGNTIESIAAEKAAIIHSGSTAVIAHQKPEALAVILERCREVGVTPLVEGSKSAIEQVSEDGRCLVTFETRSEKYENVWLGLRGRHQVENAATAIQLAEVLNERFAITPADVGEGLNAATHPGRLEWIPGEPVFLLDGAHNTLGAEALHDYLREFGRQPLTLLFGAMRDKRIEEIAECLFPMASNLVVTGIDNPRSASIETLDTLARRFGQRSVSATNSRAALKLALENTAPDGMICITGSLYLIGELRNQILYSLESVKTPT